MKDHQPIGARNDVHARRTLRIGGLAAASALVAACGPADGTDSNAEVVGQSQQAVEQCANIQPQHTTLTVKNVLTLAKDVANTVKEPKSGNPIELVINLLDAGGPTVDEQIAAQNERLFCLAQAQDWKMVSLDYNSNQFAPVSAAWMDAQGVGFARGSTADVNSHTATVAAGGLVMFERLYRPDDPATNGPWKSIITNNRPDTQFDAFNPNQVFDWRMAFPGFTRLLVARLAMIAMMDPNFAKNGLWNAELGEGDSLFPGYRRVLSDRLQQMVAGVRCDFKDRLRHSIIPAHREYVITEIACADVNTGLSAVTTFLRPDRSSCPPMVFPQSLWNCLAALPSQGTVLSYQDSLRRQVLNQMPVFEVQALIDTLYLFTHPAPDLAEAFTRIPLAVNGSLCLDVPGANPAPGTATQIWGCNGTAAQQFAYDRKAQTIRNTATGKCLQVRPNNFGFFMLDNWLPGAVAEMSDCTSPVITRQRWTYNPQSGVIHSALGTVLDVWGPLQAQSGVFLGHHHGGDHQRWRADHSQAFCNAICLPNCQASCAGAGPGTGGCVGGCMGGCMGSCMTAWP